MLTAAVGQRSSDKISTLGCNPDFGNTQFMLAAALRRRSPYNLGMLGADLN